MHSSHTPKHTQKMLSPVPPRQKCYLSPDDGQNRKKTDLRGDGSQWRTGRDIKERQTVGGAEERERISNGSLRKLEKFGKIYEPCPIATVPLAHSARNHPKEAQIRNISSQIVKQQCKTVSFMNSGDFQLCEGVRVGKGSSQYYHSQKIETGKQPMRQTRKMRYKMNGQEVAGLSKIQEVTFTLDSTQPQTEEKQQKNDYQFPHRRPMGGKMGDVGGQFLTAFRRKIIEKQIIEKEKKYRGYIRSSSRQQNPQQKTRLRSRMKEVLEDLYQLKKIVKN